MEYKDINSAKAAVKECQKNQIEIGGRVLTVEEKKDKRNKNKNTQQLKKSNGQ